MSNTNLPSLQDIADDFLSSAATVEEHISIIDDMFYNFSITEDFNTRSQEQRYNAVQRVKEVKELIYRLEKQRSRS